MNKKTSFSSVANVLMDTTYFGRKFGVMVFKDSISGSILFKQYVKYETNNLYLSGIEEIFRRGISIQSIICDGRKGLFSLFGYIPVQMCQFHQVQIVKRYLTCSPELEASKELLCHTDKESFIGAFDEWCVKWSDFLKERTKDKKTGKSHYTHPRLRSAYLSIKRNMPYLWTWYDNPELGIPNTNNGLEGKFTDLKSKLRNHNGLSKDHRKVFIDEYFKATFQ